MSKSSYTTRSLVENTFRFRRCVKIACYRHIDDGNGIMKMTHVEEGFEIKAGEKLILQRGGHHVMMMGLTSSLDQGETISVTLTFEKAGEKTLLLSFAKLRIVE